MDTWRRLREWGETHREDGLDLIRMYLGFALFAKGVAFVMQGMNVLQEMASRVGFADAILAHYVVAAHIGGGLLLAIGLATRAAAAVQIPVLAGAVLFVHGDEGLFTASMRLELGLLVLFLLVLFALVGSGRLSADRYVFGPRVSVAS
jgi:putative oxidoreductase